MSQLQSPLFLSAVAAGLLFFLVSTVEAFVRPGFDLARHAISMLSLGERGWVMQATFILSGLLVLVCASYMHRYGCGLFATILIGLYGAGLIIAGLFNAPAGLGFPPGTPDDAQPVMTTGAILHSVGFMVAFSSLIVACFVLAWQYSGNVSFALFSAAMGLAMPVLIGLGMASVVATGVAFYIAAMLAWLWLAVAASMISGTV